MSVSECVCLCVSVCCVCVFDCEFFICMCVCESEFCLWLLVRCVFPEKSDYEGYNKITLLGFI